MPRLSTLSTLSPRLAVMLLAFLAWPFERGIAQEIYQIEIDELLRKVESKDNENGFCESVTWPNGNSTDQFKSWLRSARVDTWKVNRFNNGSCQYDHVTRIHQENGAKCVTYTWHSCDKGGTCGKGVSIDCLNSNGSFTRKDG